MFQSPLTYHSELSRSLVTFSDASLLKISMNAQTKIFSQTKLNVQTYLSVFCLMYQDYMKGVCISKSVNILNQFYRSFNVSSFRQGFSVQHCLLEMVKKIKIIRDNKCVFVAVLTELSKAFDRIPHGLLIAQLDASGFDKSLSFIYFCLSL